MGEQIKNTLFLYGCPRITRYGFFSALKVFVVSFLALTLSACLPSGQQDVNTELFKNKEEMAQKTATLKPGISKKQAFETIGVPEEKFQVMSTQEVQMSIYGNSQVQGTPEQLEKFRKKLMTCQGYSLPYREIKSSSSLGLGTMKVSKTGHDLKLVLIFEDNKLMRAAVEGIQTVNQEDDQYMWEFLIKRGIGAAF